MSSLDEMRGELREKFRRAMKRFIEKYPPDERLQVARLQAENVCEEMSVDMWFLLFSDKLGIRGWRIVCVGVGPLPEFDMLFQVMRDAKIIYGRIVPNYFLDKPTVTNDRVAAAVLHELLHVKYPEKSEEEIWGLSQDYYKRWERFLPEIREDTFDGARPLTVREMKRLGAWPP